MNEEKQSIDLIYGVLGSLQKDSDYCIAQKTLDETEGLNQALASIARFSKNKAEVAVMAFKMGAYLGLQYRKLDDILK
jgi:hypothetical protein